MRVNVHSDDFKGEHSAVFLDRDGVLVRDVGPVRDAEQFELMPGVCQGLSLLRQAGFLLIMVTNQAVVARGWVSWSGLVSMHRTLNKLLGQGNPGLTDIFACPHHPHADVPSYRTICDCRKPKPGMLLKAAHKWKIDLEKSFMVGDRNSDLLAGARAGTCCVLFASGRQDEAPIVGAERQPLVEPEFRVESWPELVDGIFKRNLARRQRR